MAVYKKYLRALRKKFGYQAIWTPDTPLNLGDIGVFRNNVFEVIDNISNEGFGFEILVQEADSKVDLDFVSSKSVKITTNLGGDVTPIEGTVGLKDTGFNITFGKSGGLVFKAKDVTTQRIMNQAALARFVKEAFSNNEWKNGHYIVTEIKAVESATILYAVEKNATISLRANGEVGTDNLELTDVEAKFEIVSENSMAAKIVASGGLTPLFKVRGIKVKGESASLRNLESGSNSDVSFEEHDDAGTILEDDE